MTRKLVESTCHVEIMETMDKLVSLLIHGWEGPPPSLPQRLFDKRGHHDHAWHRIGPLTYAMHVGTDPWGFMNVITDFDQNSKSL